jgi:hypothetical protein
LYSTSSISYDDTNVESGKTYWYWITAVIGQSESTISSASTGILLSPPADVSASDGSFSFKIQITWTASIGATGYSIYRNTENIIPVNALDTSSALLYDDITAELGKLYYYWVRATNPQGLSDVSLTDSGYYPVATVGSYWVSYYTYSDYPYLAYSQNCSNGFVSTITTNYNNQPTFFKGDTSPGPVTLSDFQGCGPNYTNIFWFTGHGNVGVFCLKNANVVVIGGIEYWSDAIVYSDVQWGLLNKWIFLRACYTLALDQWEYCSYWKSNGKFAQSLNGTRLICGADSVMYDIPQDGENVANRLIGYSYPTETVKN